MTTDEKTLLLRIQSLNLTAGVDPQTKAVIDRNGIGPTREYIQAYFSATPQKKKACAQVLGEVFQFSLRSFAEDRCFAIAYVAYELMLESVHVRDAGWHLVLGPFFLENLPALSAAPAPRCACAFLARLPRTLNWRLQLIKSQRPIKKDEYVSSSLRLHIVALMLSLRLQELVQMLSEKKLFSSVYCCELLKLCREGHAGRSN
jgi:hypothetical protein